MGADSLPEVSSEELLEQLRKIDLASGNGYDKTLAHAGKTDLEKKAFPDPARNTIEVARFWHLKLIECPENKDIIRETVEEYVDQALAFWQEAGFGTSFSREAILNMILSHLVDLLLQNSLKTTDYDPTLEDTQSRAVAIVNTVK